MKIAVLGKGGSGKSSVSWLLSCMLAKQRKVLAVDEDFNMDLTSQFGIEFDSAKYIYKNHTIFRESFGMNMEEKWFDLYKKTDFVSYNIQDDIFQKLSLDVGSNIKLMVTGLGDADSISSGKCGHSHSAPLKFLLPHLILNHNEDVVIDSVAGVDMLMYGLYSGCDLALICVENLPSSIKVAGQISKMCNKLEIPYRFVQTKYDEEMIEELKNEIIGTIPFDKNITKSNFSLLSQETNQSLENLALAIGQIDISQVNQWDRLIRHDLGKTSVQLHFT
jgi:CO dehydrogenase maturation factor